MIIHSKAILGALATLAVAAGISSCGVATVVVNSMQAHDWLADLVAHPTAAKWNAHSDELISLAATGDSKTIQAARMLFPKIAGARERFQNADQLANTVYQQTGLRGLEKLTPEEQAAWIAYYDQFRPADWRAVRTAYRKQHREAFSIIPEPPDLVSAETQPLGPPRADPSAAAPAIATVRDTLPSSEKPALLAAQMPTEAPANPDAQIATRLKQVENDNAELRKAIAELKAASTQQAGTQPATQTTPLKADKAEAAAHPVRVQAPATQAVRRAPASSSGNSLERISKPLPAATQKNMTTEEAATAVTSF